MGDTLTLEEAFRVARQLRTKAVEITPDGCHIYQPALAGHNNGYGSMVIGKVKGRQRRERVHRLIWMLEHGSIPEGQYVCHTCDNRACININHLFLGTAADNTADMFAKGRGVVPENVRGKRGRRGNIKKGDSNAN